MNLAPKAWSVYLLECKDGSLYCGITDNIIKRLAAHRSGKGAKYTRGRGPLILRYVEYCGEKSDALRREIRIKRMTKQQKISLWKLSPAKEDNLQQADEMREIFIDTNA